MAADKSWPACLPRCDTSPPVSLLTPTYNRLAFLPYLAQHILAQTYPRDRMEWIVLDDGTESAAAVVADIAAKHKDLRIRYIRSETKKTIGAKRNVLHREAAGQILVTMDDDDWYSPERVRHSVYVMRSKKTPIVGSSENYLFYADDKSIWQTGPWGPQHATFGTMAYTKEYAVSHPCNETVTHAEEIEFTGRYTAPLQQLNPRKVMLVMCHGANTFSKHKLRETPSPVMRLTGFKLSEFIKSTALREYYNTLK
jgi:glycosyltransferase involved in cell wall biosynthesis